jgi:hypothetical protein
LSVMAGLSVGGVCGESSPATDPRIRASHCAGNGAAGGPKTD